MLKTTQIIHLSLFTLLLLLSAGCQKNAGGNTSGDSAADVNTYVYAYTSGVISKTDPIRIRFAQPVVTADQIGEEVPGGILSFSPGISGNGSWEDELTLLFQPEEWLRSSTQYHATVNLKKLIPDVPSSDREFAFSFKTRDQYLNVTFDGLRAPNPNNLRKQELSGKVATADIAAAEEIAQTLSAVQNGQSLQINWQNGGESRSHAFVISNIERTEDASKINISWNGKALGVDHRDEKSYEIPSLSDFKVMDVQVMQGNEQYISLRFSDPLLATQNVNGLISMTNFGGNFRSIIQGNELRIFPSVKITGEHKVTVNSGIRNINDFRMANATEWFVAFEDVKPQVRLAGKGVILPNSNGLVFPFEAIGLNAVELEVFKIYDNNILQFLQTNDLDGRDYQLHRVGRIILQKKIDLSHLNPEGHTQNWTRYALNLDELIEQDDEAIYQIRLGFRPSYSSYACPGNREKEEDNLTVAASNLDDNGEIKSILEGWYGIDGYYDGYEWQHRENPCFPAYYNSDRFVSRNVIASNLGIIAKGGKDNSYFVAVTNLLDATPANGASIVFYDFQQQPLQTIQTNGEGIAEATLERKPFFALVTHNNQKGYLRLEDGNSLSLSRFDVSGAATQKGMKGFLYGERGVWRPGDSVYLHFILEDKNDQLPANYPVTFELIDARGQNQETRVVTESVNRIYPLHFSTDPDDPTGNWIARVKAGGATFDKVLKIETIKPNRLKIDLSFGKEVLSVADEPIRANLQVNWLHGAPASNVKTKIEVNLKSANTAFEKFPSFEFDDPARAFEAEPKPVFEGEVDANGQASIQTNLTNTKQLPGKLMATFKSRAFEKGGDFSTDNFSIPYHPFTAYAGVELPENKYGEKRLNIDQNGTLSFAAVDTEGRPISGKSLSVGLYRVQWRWWWDRGRDNISRYNSNNHYDALQKAQVSTNNQGLAQWNVTVNQWGRYLVRVCDTESGHCSGDFFYAGYPWYGNDNNNREAAAMLTFSADKKKYEVGETVELTIPTGKIGKALVTLENGTKVIQSFWTNAQDGENTISFKTSPEMAPTVYAHVALLQPHGQVENDLPVRLYGVIPVAVEDPGTKLSPEIEMPDELQPEQEVTIEVSEADGKAMAYNIAIVDEGLLGLTRFKTPNPWDAFYAREALGVKTWDIYDHVLGAYGGSMERLLSIGGDIELEKADAKDEINRFKPAVMHLGPFELRRGKKAKHKIKLPNYVGAVRTMVIAANNGAYGAAEKTTPVRKPLMVLATLPRVLGPGESLRLPVTVFAMDQKVRNARVTLKENNGMARINGSATQEISFNRPGEDVLYFDVTMSDRAGAAQFVVEAAGNGERASQEIDILVRNPNPYLTDVATKVLASGDSWDHNFQAVGMPGTNTGILEVSNIPPINLGQRLNYLLRYPYGCLEQTLSGGFPQLFVDKLMELDEKQKERVPININATINRLKLFQTSRGGFTYWPGNADPNHWSTNYAGHFLLEAKALGYSVPTSMINRWVKFQQKAAKIWSSNTNASEYGFGNKRWNELNQAYRLYTLALANEPDLAAMNRLRETNELNLQAKWRLAAAYALAGKPEVAKSLANNLTTNISPYQELSYTFGSDLRDQGMILETLVLLEEQDAAASLLKDISDRLSSQRWFSTQTLSFCLLAVGKYVGEGGVSKKFQFAYQVGGKRSVNAGSNTPVFQVEVPIDGSDPKKIQVKNPGDQTLFARLILTGQPIAGQETAASSDLTINIAYKAMNGEVLDPSRIVQGTDFIAEVNVIHPGKRAIPYQEMALAQIFPSGWEIINSRLDGFAAFSNGSKPEYQDFRDDRVHTFFDLRQKATHKYLVQLNAAYQGKFYLPAVSCEAMYDNTINARVPGQWVEVVMPGEL